MFKNKKPYVIVLRTAAVLLILVTVSTSMVADRFAKYTTTVTGSDSVQIAKFTTSVGFSSAKDLTIDCYNNYETNYTITVSNNDAASIAETTIEYSVVLTLPNALTANEMSVYVDGKSPTTVSADGKVLTFEKVAELEPGIASSVSFNLTFKMNQDAHGIYYAPLSNEGWSNIALKVYAKQVD